MVRGKETKTFSLVLTCVILLIQCFSIPADSVGVYSGSPAYTHLSYPFFHDGFLHALVNCWCLLSVVFVYDTSPAMLITAYIAAVSFPTAIFPTDIPTIGLSGICCTLMGRISFLVKDRFMYQLYMVVYIGTGFMLPMFNAWLHLYCYAAGLLVGFLNMPLNENKK